MMVTGFFCRKKSRGCRSSDGSTVLSPLRVILLVLTCHQLFTVVSAHWINLHLWHDAVEPSPSFLLMNDEARGPGSSSLPERIELPNCHEFVGLTDGQVKLCLLFVDHMKAIIAGAHLGLKECRFQFRHHHWNCSSSPPLALRLDADPEKKKESTGSWKSLQKTAESVSSFTNYGGSNDDSEKDDEYTQEEEKKKKKRKNSYKKSSRLSKRTLMKYTRSRETGVGGRFDNGSYSSSPAVSMNSIVQSENKQRSGNSYTQLDDSLDIFDGLKTPASQSIIEKSQLKLPEWNAMLKKGSKEIAFAHAVWSAAVTQSIARSCRDGSLDSCGCGKTKRPKDLKMDWRWGGCGDDLSYGYKFSRNFVDIREQERPPKKRQRAMMLVNLHNNEAGRRAVLKKTKIACKCHGVSGSCALVTCWHQVPSFREIGDHLRARYEAATQVKLSKKRRLKVRKRRAVIPTVHDLIYLDKSPNYCVQDKSIGVFGTTGRVCSQNATAPDGCNNLCCDRGHTTRIVESQSRCNCKFIWCCKVVCDNCNKIQKFDVCK